MIAPLGSFTITPAHAVAGAKGEHIMKAEIKAAWLDALRSGQYPKSEGMLRPGNGFCCLGVLCDLHAKAGLGQWDGARYLDTLDVLPEEVIAWAGLSDETPMITGVPIVDLNDGVNRHHAHSFVQIADLIETHL